MSLDALAALGLQPVDADNNPATPEPAAVPVVAAPPAPAPVAAAPVEVPDAPIELTPEEAAIVAQADKPDAVQRLIDAERAKRNDANAELRRLRAEAEAAALAAVPLEQRVANAEAEKQAAEKKVAQFLVAAKHNVPFDLADRLKGDSIEELEQDAASFFGHLKASPSPAVPVTGANGGFQQTPPVQQDAVKGHDQFIAGLFQRGA